MLYKIYLYLIDISSLHCLNTEIEQGIQAAKDFGSHRVCNPVPVEARGSRFVLCVIPCNTIDIEVVVDSINIKQFKKGFLDKVFKSINHIKCLMCAIYTSFD